MIEIQPGLVRHASRSCTPARATSTRSAQASPACSRGIARDAVAQLPVDARLARVTVAPPPVSVTSSPVLMPRCFASASESSTSACGRWNCSSDDALDGGPGEERLVADELQPARPRRAAPAAAAGRRASARPRSRGAARARRPRRTGGRRSSARRPRRRRPARTARARTSKRAASCAIHSSSSGAGGSAVRRSRCRRPSRFT